MKFVEGYNLFGEETRQISCIPHSGKPTDSTEGAVGSLYMDTDTGDIYKCIKVENGIYTWVLTSNGSSGADWSVNDENESGYVKDRPLWVKEVTNTITWDGEPTESEVDGLYRISEDVPNIESLIGQNISAVIEGTTKTMPIVAIRNSSDESTIAELLAQYEGQEVAAIIMMAEGAYIVIDLPGVNELCIIATEDYADLATIGSTPGIYVGKYVDESTGNATYFTKLEYSTSEVIVNDKYKDFFGKVDTVATRLDQIESNIVTGLSEINSLIGGES